MQSRSSRSPAPARKTATIWFLVIAGAGCLLRLIYLLQAKANDPLFFAPQMDALYHHQWATAIANGVQFINDAYFRAPLYPLFLGFVYKVFGVDLVAARVVQAMSGSASCGLLYLIARRLFNERIARISGLVMALYPLVIYFDGELLIANLLIFLLLLGFLLLLRSTTTGRQWYLPGLTFGLAAIARPNVLAFVAVLAIWLLFRPVAAKGKLAHPATDAEREPGGRHSVLLQFLIALAVPIAPVAIRNYVVSKRLVLIAWQAGTNFYIGNNPNSDGTTAIVPGTRSSWWGGYYDAKRLAEQASGRELKGTEIDAYWLGQGLRFWREQPARALRLLARKAHLWFSGYEVSNDRDFYFFKRFSFLNPLIFKAGVLQFPFGLLLPLALVGFYQTRTRGRQLMPIYLFFISFSLSFIVFFVTARYRMPVVVLAIPFAVFGVERLFSAPRRELLVSAVIFVAGFVVFNTNLARITEANAAQNYFLAAKGFYDTGRPQQASEELEQALARDSAVNILSLEATIRMDMRQPARAEQAARDAIRLWPHQAEAYGLAGNVYAGLNRLDQAQSYFEQALKLDPYSVQALNNLGNLAMSRNDLKQARTYYEQALAIDPTFALATFHLGLVDYYEGRKAQAHERWRRVLQLDPGNNKAKQALQQLR
jgi:Tfp pilus assembly protein PilF/glycosyltransferase involved in cell wall biosynthesis